MASGEDHPQTVLSVSGDRPQSWNKEYGKQVFLIKFVWRKSSFFRGALSSIPFGREYISSELVKVSCTNDE